MRGFELEDVKFQLYRITRKLSQAQWKCSKEEDSVTLKCSTLEAEQIIAYFAEKGIRNILKMLDMNNPDNMVVRLSPIPNPLILTSILSWEERDIIPDSHHIIKTLLNLTLSRKKVGKKSSENINLVDKFTFGLVSKRHKLQLQAYWMSSFSSLTGPQRSEALIRFIQKIMMGHISEDERQVAFIHMKAEIDSEKISNLHRCMGYLILLMLIIATPEDAQKNKPNVDYIHQKFNKALASVRQTCGVWANAIEYHITLFNKDMTTLHQFEEANKTKISLGILNIPISSTIEAEFMLPWYFNEGKLKTNAELLMFKLFTNLTSNDFKDGCWGPNLIFHLLGECESNDTSVNPKLKKRMLVEKIIDIIQDERDTGYEVEKVEAYSAAKIIGFFTKLLQNYSVEKDYAPSFMRPVCTFLMAHKDNLSASHKFSLYWQMARFSQSRISPSKPGEKYVSEVLNKVSNALWDIRSSEASHIHELLKNDKSQQVIPDVDVLSKNTTPEQLIVMVNHLLGQCHSYFGGGVNEITAKGTYLFSCILALKWREFTKIQQQKLIDSFVRRCDALVEPAQYNYTLILSKLWTQFNNNQKLEMLRTFRHQLQTWRDWPRREMVLEVLMSIDFDVEEADLDEQIGDDSVQVEFIKDQFHADMLDAMKSDREFIKKRYYYELVLPLLGQFNNNNRQAAYDEIKTLLGDIENCYRPNFADSIVKLWEAYPEHQDEILSLLILSCRNGSHSLNRELDYYVIKALLEYLDPTQLEDVKKIADPKNPVRADLGRHEMNALKKLHDAVNITCNTKMIVPTVSIT